MFVYNGFCVFCFFQLKGFGALAALKRKRKKFSKSRNTSPVLEPSAPSKVISTLNPKRNEIKQNIQVERVKQDSTVLHLEISLANRNRKRKYQNRIPFFQIVIYRY